MTIFWSKFHRSVCSLLLGHVLLLLRDPDADPQLLRKHGHPLGTLIASISVIIGMWLERFVIVVPTLTNPRVPNEIVIYTPTWVEWSVFAGCISFFILLYMVFTKNLSHRLHLGGKEREGKSRWPRFKSGSKPICPESGQNNRLPQEHEFAHGWHG